MLTRILLFFVSIVVAFFVESYSLTKIYAFPSVYPTSGFLQSTTFYQWTPFAVGAITIFVIYILLSKVTNRINFSWWKYIIFFLIPYVIVTILVATFTSYLYMVN